MNYEEYQVWYHTYNICAPTCITKFLITEDAIIAATKMANVVVEEFKKVSNKPKQIDASKIISDTVQAISNKK